MILDLPPADLFFSFSGTPLLHCIALFASCLYLYCNILYKALLHIMCRDGLHCILYTVLTALSCAALNFFVLLLFPFLLYSSTTPFLDSTFIHPPAHAILTMGRTVGLCIYPCANVSPRKSTFTYRMILGSTSFLVLLFVSFCLFIYSSCLFRTN